MFTDEELKQMMNVGNNEDNVPIGSPVVDAAIAAEEVSTPTEAPAETFQENVPIGSPVVDAAVSEADQQQDEIKLNDTNSVTVSDVILQNVDKHIKMVLINDSVHAANADADVTNYIVYVNTDKKIPCIFDCEGLRVPTSSVKNSDGTWNITSIEGRRSGFVIKTPGRDLVMSKNFIYDCTIDQNGNITSVREYNRKNTITDITETVVPDYDAACLLVQRVLPKIVKCGKYTTIEALREQVKASYESVNDVNAMFKIVNLRLQIGC